MTMSAGLLYEKGHISADVNWDYAASFQSALLPVHRGSGLAGDLRVPFQWVTATLHYKFTKEFQVYVEGKNLTDSVARTYLNGNPLLPWAPGQTSVRARAAWARVQLLRQNLYARSVVPVLSRKVNRREFLETPRPPASNFAWRDRLFANLATLDAQENRRGRRRHLRSVLRL